jgi:hypothetical protein
MVFIVDITGNLEREKQFMIVCSYTFQNSIVIYIKTHRFCVVIQPSKDGRLAVY